MTPRLTDEVLLESVVVWRKHYRQRALAAQELGIAKSSLDKRLKVAAERGMLLDEIPPPAMPGYRVSQRTTLKDGKGNVRQESIQQKPERGDEFEMPAGHVLKGVSTLVDEDGRTIVEWRKTKEGDLDPLQIAEWLKESFRDYEPAAPLTPAPNAPAADLLTLIPCNDWHIGMFAWGKEVGENWDLKIAEATIGEAIEATVVRSPSSSHAVVLGGGDLLHADNKQNTTTGGTPQDVDGRYQKTLDVAERLIVRTVESCLRQHGHVTVRILKGNHDEHASVAVSHFLKAWFRNEPRVTVDDDPSEYFWFRFGQVMIGATHGHQSRNHIAKMPSIMAHRRAEDWGATRFRYVHGFHLHHSAKFATEGQGVMSEIHQAPIPQDAWHYGSGFLSGRSMQAITYHREFGEIGRARVAILDGKDSS